MYGTSTIIYLHFRLTKTQTGWWFQPLWKICSSVGIMIFPTEWKNQIHVPNHQPAEVFRTIYDLHQFSTGPLPVFQAIFVKDLLVFQMLSPRPTRWGPWCENRLNRAWPEGKHVCIYIYICYPPKDLPFQLFVDVKEVVFVGNLLQKQSRYTITFKKDEHILRSESTTFLEGSNLF